jgi:hypothetical protein
MRILGPEGARLRAKETNISAEKLDNVEINRPCCGVLRIFLSGNLKITEN